MISRVALCLLFSLLTLSTSAFGQLTCSTNSGSIQVAVSPVDIAPGQPFTVTAQVCPVPTSSVPVQLTFSGLPSPFPTSVTQVVNTDAHGYATFNSGVGLTAGEYGLVAQAGGPDPQSFIFGGSTIFVGGGDLASTLKGQYAFLLQGISDTKPLGAGLKGAAVGTFVADGQGGIVSGEIDVNSIEGIATQMPMTGRYTLASSLPQGTLTLQVDGNTFNGTITLDSGTQGIVAQSGGMSLSSGLISSGSLALQDPTGWGDNRTGNSGIAVLSGETACTESCQETGGAALPISAQVSLGFGSQIQSGPVGGSYPVYIQGTETVGLKTQPSFNYELSLGADNNGRQLLGSDYVEYLVDATHAYLMSIQPHNTADLLSGPVRLTPPVSQ